MFPVVLDTARLKVLLAGRGAPAAKRLELLDAAGAAHVRVFSDDESMKEKAGSRLTNRLPQEDDLPGAAVLFLAGLDDTQTAELTLLGRKHGLLVNAEDRLPWCDFHVPAQLRRGDLLLTVSTGANSPGLARRIKQLLGRLFGAEWADRLKTVSDQRRQWREQGADIAQLAELTNTFVDKEGWLTQLETLAGREVHS